LSGTDSPTDTGLPNSSPIPVGEGDHPSDGPPVPDSILHLIETSARRSPGSVAIAGPGRTPLTYGGLYRHIENTGLRLNSLGVGRCDRVAMVMPNGPEMAVAFVAVAACSTSAPLNPAYGVEELEFYLSDLNATTLMVQAGIDSPAAAVAQRLGLRVIELSPVPSSEAGVFTLQGEERHTLSPGGGPRPDDVALLLHTSGTTSRPKIVPLTHGNLCASAHNISTTLRLRQTDRCLNVMPLFHTHGLVSSLLASLIAGASVVCTPGFSLRDFFRWMKDYRPTWYTAVPTMHRAIAGQAPHHQEIIAGCPLRFVRSSSSPLPTRLALELESTFHAPVIDAYGMTETTQQIASNPLPPGQRKIGSVGMATGPEVAIVDEIGNLLPSGQVGEIVVRGTTVMRGYENNPQANQSAFLRDWLRTGDQGYLDRDGYLFITGRCKEVINRGGEKISPLEVDEVLMDHPAVAQAVTFAIPHPSLGEDVAAAVVLRERCSATEGEIRRFAGTRLAAFKVPSRIAFLEEIPRGPTGKPQRIGLAEKLGLSGDGPDSDRSRRPSPAPSTPLEAELAAIWEDILGIRPVGIHEDFLELGGDSILATLVTARARQAIQVEMSLLDFFQAPTVADLAALMQSRLSGATVPGRPFQPREPAQPHGEEVRDGNGR